MQKELAARRASQSDAAAITSIITLAFESDPLWSRAMATADGSTDHHSAFWRLFIDGALRYPCCWLTDGGEATSIWIPPGGTEMAPDQEEMLTALAVQHLGAEAGSYLELMARFDAAHPRDEPHYYLTLLATHPDHRGKGIGMSLLEHDLSVIDAEHRPAYLESSNPANNRRYERVGFEGVGEFSYPGADGPVVTTMWRTAR